MPLFHRNPPPETSLGDGIFQSLRECLATWIALGRTRLEILVTELEEEKIRLGQIIGLALLALFCLCMGVIMLSFFIVVCFWDTSLRLWAIGGVTALYLLGVLAAGMSIRRIFRKKPRLFDTTLSELSKDQDYLQRH